MCYTVYQTKPYTVLSQTFLFFQIILFLLFSLPLDSLNLSSPKLFLLSLSSPVTLSVSHSRTLPPSPWKTNHRHHTLASTASTNTSDLPSHNLRQAEVPLSSGSLPLHSDTVTV